MTQTASATSSPHQKIWCSSAGKTVKENKTLSGLTVTGAGVALAGGGARSDVFSKIIDKGIAPAAGVTIACLGGAAVHDSMINDWPEHRARAASKFAAGTLVTLSGTEIVGRSYNLPFAKQALSGILEKALNNAETIIGISLIAGGASAGQTAQNHASKVLQKSENRSAHVAAMIGASAGGTLAALAGIQMVAQQQNIPYANQVLSYTLEHLADSRAVIGASGAALIGAALLSVDRALQNIRHNGNEFATGALAAGAMASTLGGLELTGKALNIAPLKGLFINNAQWLQGLAVSAAGFAWLANTGKRIKNDTLTGMRGLEMSVSTSIALSGLAYATENISPLLSENLLDIAKVGASGGLAFSTIGFGAHMRDALENHKPEAALFNGALAACCTIGSLFTLGDAANSPMIDKIGNIVDENTLKPLIKHVISPALTFLYDNPLAGGLLLVTSAATMLHLRGRFSEESLFD